MINKGTREAGERGVVFVSAIVLLLSPQRQERHLISRALVYLLAQDRP